MIALGIVLLTLGLGGWWMTRGSGGDHATGSGDPDAMVVLPEVGEDGGLSPIGDALRVGAEANARQAFTTAQQLFAEYGTYRDVTPELLAQYQPELAWLPGSLSATDRNQVSVAVTGDTSIVIAASDGGSTCVFARDDGTGVGGGFVTVRTTSGCRADAPPEPWPA